MRRGRASASRSVEAAFVRAALVTTMATAAVAVPVASLGAGMPGTVGAGVGVALVAVLFGLSAVLHAAARPLEHSLWMSLTLGGVVVRLAIYFLVVRAFEGVEALHGLSLGLTAVLGIVVGQVLEMRALARGRPPLEPQHAPAASLEGADR